ncbi:ragulator complex protein LAMTOR1-like [Clytia hemisphaerica]|uniref:Ragulator complex protein LAMTOR1 n=1 Tax=Clytia hemisphaerica TaxID=252671 RepID=A0A7M6DKU3_9CNID|eukprot:TCONS_00049005-protein
MGCAFCKDPNQSNKNDSGEPDERSRLLDNQHQPSATKPITDDSNYHSTNSITKTDEQSQLSRILHKTAQNIIDVSAIEPHSMERSEYMDKMRHYIEKTTNSDFNFSKQKQLNQVTHAPLNILLAPNISASDIKLITEASHNVSGALSQAKITCSDSLVENFDVDNSPVPVVT